ncbi:hypothetical protein BC332_29948 [Capsicum chinense]|nr:hypothetical protein BC332_29948 [Capsicum chinense]
MQDDYAESYVMAKNEDAITNIINKFCIPAELSWHMIDEVYVPVNYGKEFHWVLAVIVLKERVTHVVTKAEKGYTSDNDDPPRPRNSYSQSTGESAIVTLE